MQGKMTVKPGPLLIKTAKRLFAKKSVQCGQIVDACGQRIMGTQDVSELKWKKMIFY